MPTLRCLFRLLPSHGRNSRGFGAKRQDVLVEEVTLGHDSCLSLSFSSLSISPAQDGGRIEAVMLDADESVAETFLDQIEVALMAHFGLRELNGYYGTVYVECDRATLEWVIDRSDAAFSDGIQVTDRLFIKSTCEHKITTTELRELRYDPILQLYADGLRAGSAESKFFHWFIILEEFLEKAKALNDGFTPLFDDADKKSIGELASLLGERKKGNLLGVLRATNQNRAEKLAAILNQLGISDISTPGLDLIVNTALCETLIAQRNQLFHRGAHIEEGPLYTTLFPIVTRLARCSEKILSLRG